MSYRSAPILVVLALVMLCGCAEYIDESAATVFGDIRNPPDGKKVMRARFSEIQDSVFTPTCARSGCHAGDQSPNLSTGMAYANIVNKSALGAMLDLVSPGVADNSYLFRKITGINITGQRMPFAGLPLSNAKIDSIRKWIENGALNN